MHFKIKFYPFWWKQVHELPEVDFYRLSELQKIWMLYFIVNFSSFLLVFKKRKKFQYTKLKSIIRFRDFELSSFLFLVMPFGHEQASIAVSYPSRSLRSRSLSAIVLISDLSPDGCLATRLTWPNVVKSGQL